jgi:hypothetical protein
MILIFYGHTCDLILCFWAARTGKPAFFPGQLSIPPFRLFREMQNF